MTFKQPVQVLSLSPSGTLLAVAYGNVIQILDTESGKLKYTTDEEESHKSGALIRHLAWWKECKLVSSAEDKVIKEWEIIVQDDTTRLVLKNSRDMPKRVNAIAIAEDGKAVVIADKFGDVYALALNGCFPNLPTPPIASFPSEPSTSTLPMQTSPSTIQEVTSPMEHPIPNSIKKSKGVHKTPKLGILKDPMKGPEWRHVPARVSVLTPDLGHVSMITSMLLCQSTGNEAIIVTADRDEHIRIGKWPEGWEIKGFLLGQRKFVSAMAVHPNNPDFLLSAGGDDNLCIWSLSSLKCMSRSLPLQLLKGTAEVQVKKQVTELGKKLKRKKSWIEKQKLKKERGLPSDENERTLQNGPDAERLEKDANNEQESEGNDDLNTKKLDLAIRKILFVGFGKDAESEDSLLILSSVGSSALLAYRTSELLIPTSSGGTIPKPQLLKLDFPILDITAIPSKRHLWVSLDVSTGEGDKAFRCYEVSGDGILVSSNHATLSSLNGECSRMVTEFEAYPNTAALYPEISLLSKDPAEEHNEGN